MLLWAFSLLQIHLYYFNIESMYVKWEKKAIPETKEERVLVSLVTRENEKRERKRRREQNR